MNKQELEKLKQSDSVWQRMFKGKTVIFDNSKTMDAI
jgi:hypothetical protein